MKSTEKRHWRRYRDCEALISTITFQVCLGRVYRTEDGFLAEPSMLPGATKKTRLAAKRFVIAAHNKKATP